MKTLTPEQLHRAPYRLADWHEAMERVCLVLERDPERDFREDMRRGLRTAQEDESTGFKFTGATGGAA